MYVKITVNVQGKFVLFFCLLHYGVLCYTKASRVTDRSYRRPEAEYITPARTSSYRPTQCAAERIVNLIGRFLAAVVAEQLIAVCGDQIDCLL